jgi:CHAT domain
MKKGVPIANVYGRDITNVMTAETITVDQTTHVAAPTTAPAPAPAPAPIKLLYLAANPRDTTRLALDEEAREIAVKIRLSEHRDLLQVVTAWAVRPDDLLQQLNEHRPTIVHFSGHGSSSGALALVDAHGNTKEVSTRALESLFTAMKDDIRLVFLNACYTRAQAEAIRRTIDFVVGMSTAVGDAAAIVFAASFYRALGFGRTVGAAFEQARTALLLNDIPEEDSPRLLAREGVSVDVPLWPEPTEEE